jgi:hypothetical protein
MILSGIHDFWLGPKAAWLMDAEPESKTTLRFRKASSWVGRITNNQLTDNYTRGTCINFHTVNY